MKYITIAGYSLAELKRQRDAIRQDANKYISNEMEKVKQLIENIRQLNDVEEPSLDDINALSKEAVKHLRAIQTITDVSGVEYYLEHDYDSLSSSLDEQGNAYDDDYESFTDLYETLQEMESQSEMWNASTC